MRFVTIDAPLGGRAGMLLGGDVLDFAGVADIAPLAAYVPATVAGILGGGADGLEIVSRVAGRIEGASQGETDALRERRALCPVSETPMLAPLPHPGIVLSHGRAYRTHLQEMKKTDNPEVPEDPSAFIKNNNSIIGSGAAIVLPPQCPDMVDFEGEFSLVFGKHCHNVAIEDAMESIAGYTIINDVSARDWVHIYRETNDPEINRMGKQLPTFCPMGPAVVTCDEVGDPHDLDIQTTLNGEVFQSSNTSDLIWMIPQLISYFSRWYPFAPGDVLTTGSPAGVGFGRDPKIFMKPGDIVSITVEGVGTLTNPVVASG